MVIFPVKKLQLPFGFALAISLNIRLYHTYVIMYKIFEYHEIKLNCFHKLPVTSIGMRETFALHFEGEGPYWVEFYLISLINYTKEHW